MWDYALSELRKLLDSKPNRRDRLYEETLIYCGLKEYGRVIEIAGKDAGGECDAALAIALARTGRLDDALRIAQAAVRRHSPNAEYCMAAVREIRGDNEDALLWFERFARRMGHRADAMRHVALTLDRLQDYAEARVAWQQAIRLGPFVRWEDLEKLAECCRRLGRDEEAAEAATLASDYKERDVRKSEAIAQISAGGKKGRHLKAIGLKPRELGALRN